VDIAADELPIKFRVVHHANRHGKVGDVMATAYGLIPGQLAFDDSIESNCTQVARRITALPISI